MEFPLDADVLFLLANGPLETVSIEAYAIR